LECKDYQELITAAIDGEISKEDKLVLDAHLKTCATCRAEYAAESSLKNLVKARIRMVPTPSPVLARITAGLAESEQSAGDSLMDRLRSLLARPLVRPALAVLVAALLVYIFTNRSKPVDILEESNATFEQVLKGTFLLQEASSEPAILKSFFAGKTAFPVFIPEMMHCNLLGGVLNEHPGGAVAHVVYDMQAIKIYLYQTGWANVLKGDGATVTPDVREELLRASWCSRVSPQGHTIVLARKGETLVVAVSDMKRDDLLMCLNSVDQAMIPH
jgi:hypothetical protein